jgi:hypothetical protein
MNESLVGGDLSYGTQEMTQISTWCISNRVCHYWKRLSSVIMVFAGRLKFSKKTCSTVHRVE